MIFYPVNLHQLFKLAMDRDLGTVVNPMSGGALNLGHGTKPLPANTVSVGLPEWDAEQDILPFDRMSFGTVYAFHFLEHIQNLSHVMAQCQRVLKVGGVMNICVPYGTCHMAVQDPDHKRFFNEDTWRHMFANPYYDPHLGQFEWKWEVGLNVIMGVKGENLALITQLIKGE